MDMTVNSPGCHYQFFSGDNLGGYPADHTRSHIGHHIGVSSFSDSGDPPVLYADVGFEDSCIINNKSVGDKQIQSVLLGCPGGLPHSVS